MKWFLCTHICLLALPLFAAVNVNVSDPMTLESVDLTDVMVGSRIALVVHADANDYWSGGLFIEGQDRAIGRLQGRGKDPNSRDWADSHLPAAGENAYVLEWKDSMMWGFDLYPDEFERKKGNWFVIDYQAVNEGPCRVDVYDHAYSWDVPDPNVALYFLNTPTRDLEPDGVINYDDFVVFAASWLADNCGDPNKACYQADFSRNGSVGLEDVEMFADFWLHGIPGWKPSPLVEPNLPDPNGLHDVTYAIVDANALSDITLEVGQSIRLYVTKTSGEESVQIFDVDAVISDPNLGWIDCTPDDPDSPDLEGTAEILATPRWDFFDYYGPSYNEPNAIELFAAGMNDMQDGDVASFVYTAAREGTVTLDLVNYMTGANLEPMTIRQSLPVVEHLQQIYETTPDLQQEIPESEWNEFIESVQEAQIETND